MVGGRATIPVSKYNDKQTVTGLGYKYNIIVYISCNPVSFAEDAHTMEQAGYRLVEAGAYDMFPQTAHVETIGYFCRS